MHRNAARIGWIRLPTNKPAEFSQIQQSAAQIFAPATICVLARSAGKARRIHLVAITKNFPVMRRFALALFFKLMIFNPRHVVCVRQAARMGWKRLPTTKTLRIFADSTIIGTARRTECDLLPYISLRKSAPYKPADIDREFPADTLIKTGCRLFRPGIVQWHDWSRF